MLVRIASLAAFLTGSVAALAVNGPPLRAVALAVLILGVACRWWVLRRTHAAQADDLLVWVGFTLLLAGW